MTPLALACGRPCLHQMLATVDQTPRPKFQGQGSLRQLSFFSTHRVQKFDSRRTKLTDRLRILCLRLPDWPGGDSSQRVAAVIPLSKNNQNLFITYPDRLLDVLHIFSQPSIYIDGWLYGMSMTSVTFRCCLKTIPHIIIHHIIIMSSRHESDIPSLPGRQVSSSQSGGITP